MGLFGKKKRAREDEADYVEYDEVEYDEADYDLDADSDEYDTDELTALLSALDAIEATVEAEPVSFRQPILDAPEGS